MRRLAVIAGGIGGALLVIVGAWSLGGRHSAGVPMVEAPGGPLRVKPENRGGMQVAGADDPILSGDGGGKQPEALAPPPEMPELREWQAPHAGAVPKVPAPARATTTTLPPAAVPGPAPSRTASVEAGPGGKATAGLTERTPVARQAAVHAAPEKPVAASESAPRTTGRMEVQLAALSSEEAAKTEWERLQRRMPELLGGHRPLVVRAEHDGHIVWRLRTGGFGDAGQASAFCTHVRAKGSGCAVASF